MKIWRVCANHEWDKFYLEENSHGEKLDYDSEFQYSLKSDANELMLELIFKLPKRDKRQYDKVLCNIKDWLSNECHLAPLDSFIDFIESKCGVMIDSCVYGGDINCEYHIKSNGDIIKRDMGLYSKDNEVRARKIAREYFEKNKGAKHE